MEPSTTGAARAPVPGATRALMTTGFTLLELLVVMGIIVLLMTVGVAGYFGMRRGAEMRGAISTVRNTLMLARQQAVTKHREVQVVFNKSSNTVEVTETLSGTQSRVHTPAALPAGIEFSTLPTDGKIVFSPLGQAGGVGKDEIGLIERAAGKDDQKWTATITVWLLTGVTKVE